MATPSAPRLARYLTTLGLSLVWAWPACAQDALWARNLAATCTGCHGSDGQGGGAMTALAGVPADRLLATLTDFRNNVRPATVMHQITKGYSVEQLRLIAGYFAALPARP